jgi:hypothetical protein
MNKLSVTEFDRMWRVVDQSLTSHSILRDRYSSWSRGSTLVILTLSIVATAGAFMSGSTIIHFGPIKGGIASWLGTLTAIIFLLTLVDLIVDWPKQVWEHEDAVRCLSELKMKMKSAVISGPDVETELDVRALYQKTMGEVSPIPDRKFLALKAKHQRKIAVSRLIDSHKGAPVMYLRVVAVIQGIRGDSAAKGKPPAGSRDSVEEPPTREPGKKQVNDRSTI